MCVCTKPSKLWSFAHVFRPPKHETMVEAFGRSTGVWLHVSTQLSQSTLVVLQDLKCETSLLLLTKPCKTLGCLNLVGASRSAERVMSFVSGELLLVASTAEPVVSFLHETIEMLVVCSYGLGTGHVVLSTGETVGRCFDRLNQLCTFVTIETVSWLPVLVRPARHETIKTLHVSVGMAPSKYRSHAE